MHVDMTAKVTTKCKSIRSACLTIDSIWVPISVP